MALLIIRDGFTVTSKFPGRAWIPPCTITYRPALPERVYDYMVANKNSGRDHLHHKSKILMEHLLSWDVEMLDKDKKRITAPLDDAKLFDRLPTPALEWMLDCVCSMGPDQFEDALNNSA